jgi:tetratricopeptide (TPR) repeat protein
MLLKFNTLIAILILVLTLLNCTSQSKKDAADFFLKGNQALSQKNYAEALRLYDEAIAKNADFSDAYLNKGITLLKLGRVEDTYEILTEAIRIDPTLTQANLVRSEAALDLGRIKEAREDLAQIEKQYLDSARFHLVKGNLLDAEGSPSLAIPEYDAALRLSKTNVEAYVNRGAVYYRMGSYTEARLDFETAITLDPAQPQALNNLGLIASKNKQWQQAIAYFDQVLARDPSEPYSLNNKAYVLLVTGKEEEARVLIEKSLDKLPKNGYALRNLGIYYQLTGHTAEALNAFNKAIEIAEPVELLYGLTGQAYHDLRNLAEACKIWKQGVVLKDSLATAEAAKYCH